MNKDKLSELKRTSFKPSPPQNCTRASSDNSAILEELRAIQARLEQEKRERDREALLQSLPSSSQLQDCGSPKRTPTQLLHHRALKASETTVAPLTPVLSYTQVFQSRPESASRIEVEHKEGKVYVKSSALALEDFEIQPAGKGWHLSFNLAGTPNTTPPGTPTKNNRGLPRA